MRLSMLAAAVLLAATPAIAEDYKSKESPYSVDETVERLEAAIEAAGAKIIASVDHSAAATNAGMQLRPSRLIIFGNPMMGTPLMQEGQSMALDLPLRIAVIEDEDGEVHVLYQDIEEIVEEHDIDDDLDAVEAVIEGLDKLTDQAVAQQ